MVLRIFCVFPTEFCGLNVCTETANVIEGGEQHMRQGNKKRGPIDGDVWDPS